MSGDSVTRDFLNHPHAAGNRFVERRTVPRYHLIAEIEVFDPIRRTKLTTYTAEIGASGCFVRVPAPLDVNTVIQVRIQKDRESFKTWGKVVHMQPGVGMGILFFRPEPNQEKILERWIAGFKVHGQLPLEAAIRST
jgi:PilZ domain